MPELTDHDVARIQLAQQKRNMRGLKRLTQQLKTQHTVLVFKTTENRCPL